MRERESGMEPTLTEIIALGNCETAERGRRRDCCLSQQKGDAGKMGVKKVELEVAPLLGYSYSG